MLGGAVAFFIMTPVIALIIFFGVKQRDEILKRRPDETDEEYNFRVQEERKKWKMQDKRWRGINNESTVRNKPLSTDPVFSYLPYNIYYNDPHKK